MEIGAGRQGQGKLLAPVLRGEGGTNLGLGEGRRQGRQAAASLKGAGGRVAERVRMEMPSGVGRVGGGRARKGAEGDKQELISPSS